MINVKKFGLMLAGLSVMFLAGCGNQLTTTKTTYHRDGLVAVVKGDAGGVKRVSYHAKTISGHAQVNDGKYVITVPVSTAKQTVTIKAKNKTVTTKVAAATSMGDYAKIAKTYNQALIASALPADVQKQLKAAGTTKPTKLTPAQQAAMAKQQAAIKAAMAKATAATKDAQLPASVSGLKQVVATAGGKIRLNVQAGQLMGIADIVPMSALKNKTQQKQFGLQFGLLATAVGANAKKVASAFQKATKDQDSSATTIKTIRSNGVKFNVGFSTSELFIYMTK